MGPRYLTKSFPASLSVIIRAYWMSSVCLEIYDNSAQLALAHQELYMTIFKFYILGMAEIWLTMKRCAAVAKKEILYVFPFGLAAWLCGTVFIDRKKGTDSRVKMSMTAEAIRTNKVKFT